MTEQSQVPPSELASPAISPQPTVPPTAYAAPSSSMPTAQPSRSFLPLIFSFLLGGLVIGGAVAGGVVYWNQTSEFVPQPEPVAQNLPTMVPVVSDSVPDTSLASIFSLGAWIYENCSDNFDTLEIPLDSIPVSLDLSSISADMKASCYKESRYINLYSNQRQAFIYDNSSQEDGHGGPSFFGEYGVPVQEKERTTITAFLDISHGGPSPIENIPIAIRGVKKFPTSGSFPFFYVTSVQVIPAGDPRILEMLKPFSGVFTEEEGGWVVDGESPVVLKDQVGATKALQENFFTVFQPEAQQAISRLQSELDNTIAK